MRSILFRFKVVIALNQHRGEWRLFAFFRFVNSLEPDFSIAPHC